MALGINVKAIQKQAAKLYVHRHVYTLMHTLVLTERKETARHKAGLMSLALFFKRI